MEFKIQVVANIYNTKVTVLTPDGSQHTIQLYSQVSTAPSLPFCGSHPSLHHSYEDRDVSRCCHTPGCGQCIQHQGDSSHPDCSQHGAQLYPQVSTTAQHHLGQIVDHMVLVLQRKFINLVLLL